VTHKLAPAAAGLVILAVLTGVTLAQDAKEPPRFEVASIKPSKQEGGRSSMSFTPGGGIRSVNQTMESEILSAFDIHSFQLTGAPAWIKDERFDITATTPPSSDPNEAGARLQTLLTERCKLAVHWDTKEMTAYVLTVDKKGSKLKDSVGENTSMRVGPGVITFVAGDMESLAENLSGNLGRPVVDQTGLAGKYDFTLKWTPDPNDPDGAWGAAVLTALREQLGLRLDSQKAPARILVIDHIERPTAN
jgi:uncharacterized protein (TIGR03435 family)